MIDLDIGASDCLTRKTTENGIERIREGSTDSLRSRDKLEQFSESVSCSQQHIRFPSKKCCNLRIRDNRVMNCPLQLFRIGNASIPDIDELLFCKTENGKWPRMGLLGVYVLIEIIPKFSTEVLMLRPYNENEGTAIPANVVFQN